jgi:imidazolonepropionase-like amidohydrolase
MLAITDATIYTVTKGIISKGAVLFKGGKVLDVGNDVKIPEGCPVICGRGKIVTPGLIDSHSHLGIFGQPSVPANEDGNETTDPVTPHLRGWDSLNPRDPAIGEVLTGGVTAVYTGPGSANVIGGTGFVMKLRGRTVEQMVIPGTEGMKMALGENPKRVYGLSQRKVPKTRMASAAVLRETLVKAQNYLSKIEKSKRNGESFDRDLKMEMLCKVLKREMKARIHAHRADDILTAIRIANEFSLDFVIEHATEGYLISDILAQKNILCTVGPLLMSQSKMELTNVTLKNPGILAKAGVKVAIQCDTSWNTKWLGLHAGLAVREGMPADEALKAVTINAAEILGVSEKLGSIEKGKDADLVIWSGHPFETLTVAEQVFIDGEKVYQREDPLPVV